MIYTLSKCLRPSTKSSAVSVIFFDETACKIGRNVSNDTRSDAFCVCTKRLTSASVGFCPRARKTSPTWLAWRKELYLVKIRWKNDPKCEIIQIILILVIDLTGTIPSPFVSKSIKASWNSPIRSSLKDDFPDIVMALKQKNYILLQITTAMGR